MNIFGPSKNTRLKNITQENDELKNEVKELREELDSSISAREEAELNLASAAAAAARGATSQFENLLDKVSHRDTSNSGSTKDPPQSVSPSSQKGQQKKSFWQRLKKSIKPENKNDPQKAEGGGSKKKKTKRLSRKNKRKTKRISRKKTRSKKIKSGATVYDHNDIVLITAIIDDLLSDWSDKDKHHEHKMKLKDYLKNEIDPPLTEEQINKLINRIATFYNSDPDDPHTTYPMIRSWINSSRGISSGSKKKKKSKKRKGKKTKNLRSSKIKNLRKKRR